MPKCLVLLPAGALAAAAASCIIHVDGSGWQHGRHLTVGGVELEESREVSLEIEGWHASGLKLGAAVGDVRVERHGHDHVVAVLHEEVPGDARLVYAEGELRAESRSGRTVALGKTTVYVSGELAALHVTTGTGDLRLEGVGVAGRLTLSTGVGDVRASATGAGDVLTLRTGIGDVRLRGAEAPEVVAKTGTGDVSLDGVTTERARLTTSVGDVRVSESHLGHLHAETGVGDIRCPGNAYDGGTLSAGVGDVSG